MYKGVLKISYDRGYVVQTKSLLLEGSSTAAEVVCQLFEALGLRGDPEDYALEERNIVTGGKRGGGEEGVGGSRAGLVCWHARN